jgi:hypothetical protein
MQSGHKCLACDEFTEKKSEAFNLPIFSFLNPPEYSQTPHLLRYSPPQDGDDDDESDGE